MKLGLQIPSFTWPPSPTPFAARLADIARRADDAGVHSVWVMDHFFQLKGIGPPEWAMLEAYSTLSFLAGVTENVWLGTLVTGVTYRQPAVLVKTVTALDVLSQGRAYLGIGAAWNEEEHRGLGITFPSTKERFERLEETLQIARQMFAGDDTPFEGRHYQLERPLNSPLPVQRPRPPILIGGGGEKKTLRMVAQYADACNLFEFAPAEVARKLGVLRDHCQAVGRDYAEIEKTTLGNLNVSRNGVGPSTTVSQVLDRYAEFAELGIHQAIVNTPDVTSDDMWELIPEIVEGLGRIPER